MKYILDFDHTLLDTTAFVDVVVRDGRENILITPTIWSHYDVRTFLYEDVLGWLRSKPKDSLYILTAITPELGPLSTEFQKEKLFSGKFDEFVSGVTFMVGEKGEMAAEIASQFPPQEPVVFIDDRPEQCLSVKQHLPQSHCFLMVRSGSLPEDLPAGIIAVSILAEVDVIMKGL